MRQSEVGEHSPKIGVRHIHIFSRSSSLWVQGHVTKNTERDAGEERKEKKKANPNYLLTLLRENVV